MTVRTGGRPLAIAYQAVAELLPTDWFLKPPPPSGLELVIIGSDGITTRWLFGHQAARAIADLLACSTRARIIERRAY